MFSKTFYLYMGEGQRRREYEILLKIQASMIKDSAKELSAFATPRPLPHSFFKRRFYLFIFRQRGGREEERERNIDVWLPLMRPLLGTWPTTQACVRTGNQTSDPLVCKPALNPLSHTSQGSLKKFFRLFLLSWI